MEVEKSLLIGDFSLHIESLCSMTGGHLMVLKVMGDHRHVHREFHV